jgi:prepilin-type N-terminal cleavage/methylation domain-containing protein
MSANTNLQEIRPRCARSRGFSMIELAVVMAIMLTVAAFALPQLMTSIYMWRVRSAANDLAGLIQQGRILAEKQNTTLAVYTGTVNRGTGAFVNCSVLTSTPCSSGGNGTTFQSGDPEIAFANGVTNSTASSAPGTLSPGFTPEAAGTVLYFGPRGLPEKTSGATYVLSNGVVFYITDNHNDWAAVSVSGAGRSKIWMWNGTSWQ